MKKNLNMFKVMVVLAVTIYLIDLNLFWYKHPFNQIPVAKYSIIALSILLLVLSALIIYGKEKKRK